MPLDYLRHHEDYKDLIRAVADMNIQTFNYLESALWFSIAITLFIYTFNKLSTSPYKNTALILALALLAFAVSDIIEAQTGAWYRPVWLLLLKALCVLTLLGCYYNYISIKKSKSPKRP